jgi:hypothetical protein
LAQAEARLNAAALIAAAMHRTISSFFVFFVTLTVRSLFS